MPSTLIVPAETRERLALLAAELRNGQARPGERPVAALGSTDLRELKPDQLLAALLDTKLPCIFAESAVRGDGSDWAISELALLGDLSVATDVTVFDDGRHQSPTVHPLPFPATLVFTPGALLRNDLGGVPADWAEVTNDADQLDAAGFSRLYERRLYPIFCYIAAHAARLGVRALVTVPGIGCGQFAGPFRGRLGSHLEQVLEKLLINHGHEWPALRALYYDPYAECSPRRARYHGIDFLVRPLQRTPTGGRPQLCLPGGYAECPEDDFAVCRLYSLVAWDHVSWPGNDFNAGARATDDGVKAAATSALHAITGVEGRYDAKTHAYLPPTPARTWDEILARMRFSELTTTFSATETQKGATEFFNKNSATNLPLNGLSQ